MPMPSIVSPRRCRPIAVLLCCLALAATARAESPAWLMDGQPTPAAREAVAILGAAASEGLDPADYDAARLNEALAAGNAPPGDFAAALTLAMQRFLRDVQRGRIDPAGIGERYDPALGERPDPAQLLGQAVSANQVAAAVAAARPQAVQYEALRAALARYRALADDPAWQSPLPPLPGSKLEPGKPWSGLARLA